MNITRRCIIASWSLVLGMWYLLVVQTLLFPLANFHGSDGTAVINIGGCITLPGWVPLFSCSTASSCYERSNLLTTVCCNIEMPLLDLSASHRMRPVLCTRMTAHLSGSNLSINSQKLGITTVRATPARQFLQTLLNFQTLRHGLVSPVALAVLIVLMDLVPD